MDDTSINLTGINNKQYKYIGINKY